MDMGRLAVRLAGCAVAVAIATPALLVGGGGLGVVAAGAGEPRTTCPPGQHFEPSAQGTSSSDHGRKTTYPIGHCALLLSSGQVKAGHPVTVTGSGYPPGATVIVSLGGTALGTVTTNGRGSFTTSVVIPSSTRPGAYQVTASGGGLTLTARLVVTKNHQGGNDHNGHPADLTGTRRGGDHKGNTGAH